MMDILNIEFRKLLKLKTLIIIILLIIIFSVLCYRSESIYEGVLNSSKREIALKIEETILKVNKLESNSKELKEKGDKEEYELTTINLEKEKKALNALVEKQQALEDKNKMLDAELKLLKEKLKEDETQNGIMLSENTLGKAMDIKSLYQKEFEKLSYYKEKNIVPEQSKLTASGVLNLFSEEVAPLFMSIIIILLVSDILSIENSEGTLRVYLSQPLKKTKVFWSKYAAAVVSAILIVGGIQLIFFLILGIKNGFDSLSMPSAYGANYQIKNGITAYIENSQRFISSSNMVIYYILFQILYIIAIVSLGMVCTVIFNRAAISLTAGSALILFFNFAFIETKIRTPIQPYTFICYGDLWNVLSGNAKQINPGITIDRGIAVLIITSIICTAASYYIFRKKEIYT
ncbi:hypothetical protein HMPREF1982_03119 [Clostridiales bacterium oral taxon 876 str. F0540]|nr:hypothetical protein HMPREF1982_03119 [Clostridiales bacterium oral taxon 876 str. F0540]